MPIHHLVLAALLCGPQIATAQTAGRIQPYVAESKLYGLYKPADWRVREDSRPDSFRIVVNSPDGASTVDFFWAPNAETRFDAVRFLAAYREMLSQTHPDVALSDVFVSRDGAKGVATVRFREGQNVIGGRYYFEANPNRLSAQGYTAPQAGLTASRPLLLNVMASFAFTKAQPRTAAGGGRALQPVVQIPLVPRRAQDGSLSMQVPEDWTFLGAGGKVVAFAQGGGMGFIFTSFTGNPMLRGATIAQGVIATQYQPPPRALATILEGLGHRNVRIRSAQPDRATNQQFAATMRRQCDAQDIAVAWTSNGGAECLGSFKMINSLPSVMGQWFSIMAGTWGPGQDLYRYLPTLERVAASFSINDQYARQYIQAGLENLRRLQQQTQAAMQDLNRAREQNQADWEARQARKDFMDSKWDDYRRGNSYWVSDLEGGKVYHTDNWGTRDTVTGDYWEGKGYNWVNFEGQNPNYPSENMREVSSYELQHPGQQRR